MIQLSDTSSELASGVKRDYVGGVSNVKVILM
jgi:hypothetical protein